MSTVLFDFDGTLIDTWPGIEETLRASFRSLDLTVRHEDITTALVGMPLLKVFEKLLGPDIPEARLAVEKYRELFPESGISGSRPFDGVIGMLEKLKEQDTDLFIVTARNEAITKQMMDRHGLARFFEWVRGEREGEVLEGKAGMVAEVLQRFNLSREDCIMVGDRQYDIEAALANGIGAVGVTYGYGTREELINAGADTVINSIEELEKLLLKGV